ncbi:MAG: hypothetical protein FJZ96_09415 [Chloroflexi bacterium]|nr:hypothetical protein [Chloroflexota bacterium]
MRFVVISTGILLVLAGLLLALVFLLPYDISSSLLDNLAADGSLEFFTPERYVQFRLLWLGGAILAGAGGAVLVFSQRLASILARFCRQLALDRRAFFALFARRPDERWERWTVAALTVISAFQKIAWLSQPMNHDESYTFIAFAARPFFKVISDYHLPNNHIFHTILVYISYHTIGAEPWMVRLPAFLAGVLFVPAAYLAARGLFSRPAAVLSAAIVAVLPVVTRYADTARGYTLVGLFSLLLVGLAAFVRTRPNRFAWLLLAGCAALGMYTIPIMLYPFGVVMTWLFLSWLARDVAPEYSRMGFLAAFFASGGLALLLAGLCYTPALVFSGFDSLAGNAFVRAQDWGYFYESLFARLGVTWTEWTLNLPGIIVWVLVAGSALALVFHRRVSKHRVPLLAALLSWMAVLLLIQRVAPEPRVWFFALPLLALYPAAGLALALSAVAGRGPRPAWLPRVILATALVIGLSGLAQSWSLAAKYRPGEAGADEQAVLFLEPLLAPGDVILTAFVDGPMLRYYAHLHDLPEVYFEPGESLETAYVLVNTDEAQSLGGVTAETGLSALLDLDSAELVGEAGYLLIYRVPALEP